MSPDKVYGVEGPPQLRGRVEDVPAEVLDAWIATRADAVWAFGNPEWWRKRVRCRCGRIDAFEVRMGDASHAGWISGELGGCQRTDLLCTNCGEEIRFFDDGVHGYNAFICDDRDRLPGNYDSANRALLKTPVCACGGMRFR